MPTTEEIVNGTISGAISGVQTVVSNGVHSLVSAAVALVICLVAVKVILSLFNRVIQRFPIEPTLCKFARSALKVLLYFMTLIIVMASLKINTSSLIALLSVAGLAMSLALQNTLSNLAGGIMLLVSKPFVVGDYVIAGGVEGSVQEIGLVYTKVNTVDNKRISIPNSEISAAKIINCSTEGRRRMDLTFSTSYDAPVEKVKNALMEAIQTHDKALMDPPPFVRLSAYKDSSIEYTIRVWCENADYWDLHFDILERVKELFDRDGIEMTYNHLNVHMMPREDS